MNTSAWNDLPNAAHIDWVIRDLSANPSDWDAAHRGAAHRGAAQDAAYIAAWDAAYLAARGAARGVARDAAWFAAYLAARGAARDAAYIAAWDAAWFAAYLAARGAIQALIAYDHAGALFDRPLDQVRVMAYLGQPAAILMLPACVLWAKEKHVLMAASERP